MPLAGTSAVPSWAPSSEAEALADGDALAGGDDAEAAVAGDEDEDEDEALEQPTMRLRTAATGTLR
jgi:hypothetical protein